MGQAPARFGADKDRALAVSFSPMACGTRSAGGLSVVVWAGEVRTMLRLKPMYCGCCCLSYTQYTPSGFSPSRLS
ncbi:hypothetical protein TSOC_007235, partial [Tetrabaena socialis]